MVVAGTTASNPWIADLARSGAVDVSPVRPSTPEEGFHLRLLADGGRRLLAVAGTGPLGVLYGADELAARIAEAGTADLSALEGLDERDGPHFALRAFKMVPPLRDDSSPASRRTTGLICGGGSNAATAAGSRTCSNRRPRSNVRWTRIAAAWPSFASWACRCSSAATNGAFRS